MLPFLSKIKKNDGVIMKTREPDEDNSTDSDTHEKAIMACAHELITAVHAHDADGVASAMKNAFEILEQMPHDEVEHAEPHSYEASKE